MEAAEVAAVVGMVAERLLDGEDYDEHAEGVTEESLAEVMRWFELEIMLAAGANALPPPPPPPAARYYATTAVGERRESCGPSLSAAASTVMASVDARPCAGAPPPPLAVAQLWPWTWPAPRPAAGEEEDDVDDEWVSQFLTDGPPPVEEQHGAL